MTTHYDGKCKLLDIAVGTTNPKIKPKRTYQIRTMRLEMKPKKRYQIRTMKPKMKPKMTPKPKRTPKTKPMPPMMTPTDSWSSVVKWTQNGPCSSTNGLHLCKPRSFAHQHPDTSPLLNAAELSHTQQTLPILPSRVFTSARMESVYGYLKSFIC